MTTDNTEPAKAMRAKQQAAYATANKDDLPPDLVARATLTEQELDFVVGWRIEANRKILLTQICPAATLKALRVGIAEGERAKQERLRALLQRCLWALEEMQAGESGYALYATIQQLCADIEREMKP